MAHAAPERLQKWLSRLGLASRREAEAWIRQGRLTVNGAPATLGVRVGPHDLVRLDSRLIRQRAPQSAPVFLCHRSPGEPLLPRRTGARAAHAAAPEGGFEAGAGGGGEHGAPGARREENDSGSAASLAERLPRRAGRRFISISPMPGVDGGLELLTADGALAERLQRAVHSLPVEFSLRIRGELSEQQIESIRSGELDRGSRLRVMEIEPAGGEGSNRWYRLLVAGASGNSVRQLVERSAATLVRVLRTRLGALELPRGLARGQWRELQPEEIRELLRSPGSDR